MTRVAIRVDAHHQIGYGHLKRCLVLGKAFQANDVEVSFLLAGDDLAKELAITEGFPCKVVPGEANFSKQAETLVDDIPDGVSMIVTDIAHPLALKDSEDLEAYFETIQKRYKHVAIDGSGEVSLRQGLLTVACDVLVSPYVGETEAEKLVPYDELLGADYFILGEEYSADHARDIRPAANRVLVTSGGSDPIFVTADVLSALALCTDDILDVKVIIGPGFKCDYVEGLRTLANKLTHQLTFIIAPDNLAKEMFGCDLAISTSGLTKYELAATGTPTILMSIDHHHHYVNQSFSSKGSVIDLGVAEDVSSTALADCIMALLWESKTRKKQSIAGQNLVDGNGAYRLARSIINLA